VFLAIICFLYLVSYGNKESFSVEDISNLKETNVLLLLSQKTKDEYLNQIKWTGLYNQFYDTGSKDTNTILNNRLKEEHFCKNCGNYGDNSYVCRGGVGPGCYIQRQTYEPLTRF